MLKKNFYVGNGKIGINCFSNCLPACPDGWEPFEGKCYLWVTNQTKSWRDAEGFCKKEKGHLASVTTKRINKYMLGRVGQSEVWIGATDQKTEGKWEWTDNCSPWDFEAWIHPLTLQRKDNCAELYNRGENDQGWNDAECHKALNFVCARPICPGEPIDMKLREDPFGLTPPTFGHCPFGGGGGSKRLPRWFGALI